MISECVRCKHLRGRFQQQKMADLPRDMMSEEAPFTFCGLETFGPFVVKNARKEMKQYRALYTCLSSMQNYTNWGDLLIKHWFLHHVLKKIHWSKRECSLDRVQQRMKLYWGFSRVDSSISRNGSFKDQ